jgi:hypothetical protein
MVSIGHANSIHGSPENGAMVTTKQPTNTVAPSLDQLEREREGKL